MLCFLSKEKDPSIIVKKEEIFFLSCPDGLSKDDMRVRFAAKVKSFAEQLNLNKVYLHFGKEYLEYEFSV